MAYNKLSFVEASRQYPTASQIQYRIQDNSQFPDLPPPESEPESILNTEIPQNNNKNKPKSKNQPKTNNKQTPTTTQMNNNHTPSEYITKSELEQIVNQLKVEIVKQLNVTKLISKIKEIQETIKNNISKSNEENSQIDNHKLLIDINLQLSDLVNPEILQKPKPPDVKV